jgi:vitamin B12 transporter
MTGGTALFLSATWFFSEENELLFGLDYQNYWGKDEVTIIKGDNEEVYAGFFSLRPHFDFLPELKSAIGGRYNKTGGNKKFVWNISARSPLFGPLYARAAVGTNFRLANAYELYADEDDTQGNPDLKPEESFNVEAGVGAVYGFIEGEVGYYHCEVTDRIAIGDDGGYGNTDEKVKLDTVEVQLATQPMNGISLGVSAVFTEAEEDGSDEQIENIPEYFYKGLIRYQHPSRRFGGDITCRYIGDVHGRNYTGLGNINYGNYWVADLSTFVRFGTDLAHMLTLRIDNLFDEDYAGYGYERATGSDGEDFLYEHRGIPFTMMLSYAYEF